MKKLAFIISSVFEPMVMLLFIGIAGAIHAGFAGQKLFQFLLFIGGVGILPVVAFRLWYMKTAGADWDLRDLKKRMKPLMVQVVLSAADIAILQLFGFGRLTPLFVLFFVWIAGFALVSKWWKISGHSATIALASGLFVVWYGWIFWPILLAVPLVSWARVVKKDHTPAQVVAGSLYSWLLVFAAKALV